VRRESSDAWCFCIRALAPSEPIPGPATSVVPPSNTSLTLTFESAFVPNGPTAIEAPASNTSRKLRR
jgi:hypothetical protein